MCKDRLDMYKESYNEELSRRDKLNSELNIPIAIVTLLFGSITYIVGNITSEIGAALLLITLLAFALMMIFLAFAVFYLIKSYYNYAYEYIAHSKQMEDYYNSLIEHYKDEEMKNEIVEDAFEAYLIKDYCKCNETNTLNNDNRAHYLHNARTAIIIALIACVISMGASSYDKIISTTRDCINDAFNGKEVESNGENVKPTGAKPTITTTPTSSTSATTN